jgi:hypothetical protein
MSEIITIPIDLLFFPYKPDLVDYYQKYWRKDGNYLWMGNHPLTLFAEDYIKYGKKVLENLDSHIFIKYEYDRYSEAPTVKNDTHKYNASRRIIDMVDSVKKYGYCQNKYDKSKHLIRVIRNVDKKYMINKEVYVLKSKKHRASACCVLGIRNIKVKVIN